MNVILSQRLNYLTTNALHFHMNNHRFTAKCQDDISQNLLEHNENCDQCFSVKGNYKVPGQSKQILEHFLNLNFQLS